MSIARQVDCILGDGVMDDISADGFVSLYNFIAYCETNGLCTIIATQWGDGGTGFDFEDESNPTGANAWVYAEWDAGAGELFGILIQYSDENNFGSSPGNPGSKDALNGAIALAMAVCEDGSSPWNGSTDNDGADTKGDPVWDGGASTCHVFPMANNPAPATTTLDDYTYADSRERCVQVMSPSGVNTYHRFHFFANEDTLVIFINEGNSTGVYKHFACGRYVPHGHMTASCPLPYYMARSGGTNTGVFELGPAGFTPNKAYGSQDGLNTEEGGILVNLADGVIGFVMYLSNTGSMQSTYQPNTIYATPRYEILPFVMNAYERYPIHRFGSVGQLPIELVGYTDEVVVNEINAAATIAVFGHNTTGTAKTAVSWDGGAAPSPSGNTTGTRLGRQSYTA